MMIATAKSLAFGLLVMYSYLTSPREQGMGYIVPVEKNAGSLGLGQLNNRVTFMGAFMEMLFWGYLWTTLKEERRELATRIKGRREEAREKGDEDWDR
jgi:Increased loss of mitochondrial DNA protein 1